MYAVLTPDLPNGEMGISLIAERLSSKTLLYAMQKIAEQPGV